MPYCIGHQVRTSTVIRRSSLHSLRIHVNNGRVKREVTYSILVRTAVVISNAVIRMFLGTNLNTSNWVTECCTLIHARYGRIVG